MSILLNKTDGEENSLKFQKLYNKYKNTMYSVAYDICKNKEDAEDIVEESFIKVIKILYKIEKNEINTKKCKNLMITITKNTAIDFNRKRKKQAFPFEYIEHYQKHKDVEKLYIDTEDYKELIVCISQLDRKYKDILRLKILNELSSKEIASILNISEKNVNMRFMRAKKLLKEKLKECKKHE